MATVGTLFNLRTLKSMIEDKKIADVIHALDQRLPAIGDLPMQECNAVDHHLITRSTGNIAVGKRRINQGVAPQQGAQTQVRETCAMYESRSHMDEALYSLANAKEGGGNKARYNADMQHVKGQAESFFADLIYGDESSDPDEFNGLATRFATPSTTINTQGFQMVSGGGTGSTNTSIFGLVLGDYCYGIHKAGSPVGIQMVDNGKQEIYDSTTGGRVTKYETVHRLDAGLAIADYHAAGRICNIDVSLLSKSATSGADLDNLMQRLIARLDLGLGQPVLWVPFVIESFLRQQLSNKANNNLTWDFIEEEDRRVMMYGGIPIRRVDAILSTEGTVSGTFSAG